jgi:hypothetical protein
LFFLRLKGGDEMRKRQKKKNMKNIQTGDDLYRYARKNGIHKTAKILRRFVELDEPDYFMPWYTTRAMCRTASMALQSIPIDYNRDIRNVDTAFGMDFYFYMWSGEDFRPRERYLGDPCLLVSNYFQQPTNNPILDLLPVFVCNKEDENA